MTNEEENLQNVNDFANSFIFLIIAVSVITIILTLFLLSSEVPIYPPPQFEKYSHVSNVTGLNITSHLFQNGSINGILIGPNSSAIIFHNNENKTTLLFTISRLFSLSTVSTAYNSIITDGSFLNFFLNNFAVLIAVIGAFSLYCFFYFSITFKADVISEYSESEQKNHIIFFQTVILSLILFGLYAISFVLFKLPLNLIELIFVGCFFILEIGTSVIFATYAQKIRTNYRNMVQFAALRDYYSYDETDILSSAIYFISIWIFFMIFLIVAFAALSDFNIFSIIFIITLILMMIWQINIVNNEPRRIFEIKIKDTDRRYQGFLLRSIEKEILSVLVNDGEHVNKVIEIPRTSIESVVLNRKIKKADLIGTYHSFIDTLRSYWVDLTPLLNFLKILFGFTFGLILGAFLFVGVAILNTDFGFPPQILIVVLLVLAVIIGVIGCRAYQKYKDTKSEETP